MSDSDQASRAGRSPADRGRQADPARRPGARRRRPASARTAAAPRLRRGLAAAVIMVVAGVLLLLVFHYLPMLGNVVAFQDYNPYAAALQACSSPWVGLGNFQALFADPAFWDAFAQHPVASPRSSWSSSSRCRSCWRCCCTAILSSRLRGFVQTVVYLPHFFSWVLVVTFFVQMLGGAGLLSQTCASTGSRRRNIMTNPDTFIVLVTAEAVWKDVGWGTSSSWPRWPPSTRTCTRRPRSTAPAAGGGCGTSPCPACAGHRAAADPAAGRRAVGRLRAVPAAARRGRPAGRRGARHLRLLPGVVTGDYGYGAAAGLFKGVVGLVLILAANKFAHPLGERGGVLAS